MTLIGITGGVGMGKSTCSDWLVRQGLPLVDTDRLAHEFVQPGQPALTEIAQRFGSIVLTPAGHLDRARLAERVFSDVDARRALESILHPRIREMWRSQADEWRRQKRVIGVIVIPLLYETGAEKELDVVACIACTNESQRRRLLDRGWNDTIIDGRLRAQMRIEEKMGRADYVIWTEGELQVTFDQLKIMLGRLSGGR